MLFIENRVKKTHCFFNRSSYIIPIAVNGLPAVDTLQNNSVLTDILLTYINEDF